MSKISVSIVLYNTDKEQLDDAINSCVNSLAPIDIYLIDNSPNDGLSYLKSDKRVRYLKSEHNGGFGSGHNLAINEFGLLEKYGYHLVMNPDITFDAKVIEGIVAYMDGNLTTGVLMPRIINTDGSVQFARRLLPKPFDIFIKKFFGDSSYVREYEMVSCEPNEPVEVVGLCGCFLFFRTEVLKSVGLFDDRYFMYFEDFDLCRRVSESYKTIYFPLVEVIHDSNREHRRNLKLFYYALRATFKYFNKWGYIDKERNRLNTKVYKKIIDGCNIEQT